MVVLKQDKDWLDVSILQNGDFNVDVHIIAEGVKMPCHQLILVASCELFAKALRTDSENDIADIIVPGVSSTIVKAAMEFIYTGTLVCKAELMNEAIALLMDLRFKGNVVMSELLEKRVSRLRSCNSQNINSSTSAHVKNPVNIESPVLCKLNDLQKIEKPSAVQCDFSSDAESISSELDDLDDCFDIPATIYSDTSDSDFEPSTAVSISATKGSHRTKRAKPSESVTNISNSDTSDSDFEPSTAVSNNASKGSHRTKRAKPSESIACTPNAAKGAKDSKHPRRLKPKPSVNSSDSESSVTLQDLNTTEQAKRISDSLPKCRFCEEEFMDHRTRTKHEEMKHGLTKPFRYSCDQCDQEFKYPAMLTKHRRVHTYGKMVYPCKRCDEVFDTQMSYKIHEKQHLKKICTYCRDPLTERQVEHNEKCSARQRILSTARPEGFVNFVVQHPTTQKNSKSVQDKSALNSKLWTCKYCEKSYTRNNDLILHLVCGHGVPEKFVFDCTECENRFPTKRELDLHVVVHNPNNPFVSKIRCTICDEYFANQSKMNTHRRHKHPDARRHCQLCNLSFTLSEFSKHRKTHPKRYQCHVCGKSYGTLSSLYAHKLVHSDLKFKCESCGMSFTNKPNLQRHIKVTCHKDRGLPRPKAKIPTKNIQHESFLGWSMYN